MVNTEYFWTHVHSQDRLTPRGAVVKAPRIARILGWKDGPVFPDERRRRRAGRCPPRGCGPRPTAAPRRPRRARLHRRPRARGVPARLVHAQPAVAARGGELGGRRRRAVPVADLSVAHVAGDRRRVRPATASPRTRCSIPATGSRQWIMDAARIQAPALWELARAGGADHGVLLLAGDRGSGHRFPHSGRTGRGHSGPGRGDGGARGLRAVPGPTEYARRDTFMTAAAAHVIRTQRPNLRPHPSRPGRRGAAHRRPRVGRRAPGLCRHRRHLGELMRAADEAGIRARTAFVVTGDHGFYRVHSALQPNVILRQAGLLATAARRPHRDAGRRRPIAPPSACVTPRTQPSPGASRGCSRSWPPAGTAACSASFAARSSMRWAPTPRRCCSWSRWRATW